MLREKIHNLEEEWGWFVYIDEEPIKNNLYLKRISIPYTITEDKEDKEDKEINTTNIINKTLKNYETDIYLYIGCIATFLTYMISKL